MDGMPPPDHSLRRVISLPLLVLYGLGVTIGAGIYVLIGETAAEAGRYAPASFLVASFVMTFSALSFAELSGRYPKSAGEAVYVGAGFNRGWLTLATGLLIIASAIIAAAAITLGGTGYIRSLVAMPEPVVVTLIVLLMGTVAAYGILESVTFAAIFTVIEILGLLAIIVAGVWTTPTLWTELPTVLPPLSDGVAIATVISTSLIAFFAFIGFDDVVNLVEETKDPRRTMPIGIILTLVVATVLYFLVVSVAVLTVPLSELAGSSAPIGLMFERLTGLPPVGISIIAIIATLNGIVIQIIMASRVVYGLGRAGQLPRWLSAVNPVTQTPLIATVVISALVLILALFLPIGRLAEMTTQVILIVFTLVNASLVRIKLRGEAEPEGIFRVPVWVPVIGVVTCLFLLIGPLLI